MSVWPDQCESGRIRAVPQSVCGKSGRMIARGIAVPHRTRPVLILFPPVTANSTSDLSKLGLVSLSQQAWSDAWQRTRSSRDPSALCPVKRIKLGRCKRFKGFLVGSMEVGGIVFACTFGGALVGMTLARPASRASPQCRFKGRREARNGPDRHVGRAGSGTLNRIGQELVRLRRGPAFRRWRPTSSYSTAR